MAYQRAAKLLWALATWSAKQARKLEGLAFDVKETPGFDFKSRSYWYELCETDDFKQALMAMCASEEAKCVEYMRTEIQIATGKPIERWTTVAASNSAANVFREFPLLAMAYGGLWQHAEAERKKQKVSR